MYKGKGERAEKLPDLSRLEEEMMDVVWGLGECGSAEVIEAYNRKGKPLADTTIRTVLTNLRKKGYLELVPSVERSYRFRSTVSREGVAKRVLGRLVGTLFDGSPRLAMLHLLGDAELSEDERNEIREILQRSRDGEEKD